PDDTAHQDTLNGDKAVTFAATPFAELSAESQPNPDATPTAAAQEQQAEQKDSDEAAAANQTALQAAVQTVMLGADVNAIPVSRIQLMWENGLASYYNPDPNHIDKNYAYVADAQGNNIVVYVFKLTMPPTPVVLPSDIGVALPNTMPGTPVYSLIYTYTGNLGESTANVEQMLQLYRTQAKEDYFFQMAFDQEKLNASKAYQGRLEFTLNLIPFGSAADNFTQAAQAQNSTARQKFLIEGSISLAGDIATLASFGVGAVTKTGAKVASQQVVRNVRIGAALIDGASGGVRAAQGVVALYNGEDGAMGYFGEATLMLMGASSSLIAEVKAARLAKQLDRAGDVAGAAGKVGGAKSLTNLRDVANVTPARMQVRDDTCGLYAVWNALEDMDGLPQKFTVPAELRNAIRANGGVNEAELAAFVNGLDDQLWAFTQRNVREPALAGLLARGDVIAHVDGNHWVRVVSEFSQNGQEWVRIFDSGVGAYYDQLLTSFMTRVGADNAVIVLGKLK
ncbi:MAG: hypothetical protein ACREHD_21810, partial [Pirellulales bacterium]